MGECGGLLAGAWDRCSSARTLMFDQNDLPVLLGYARRPTREATQHPPRNQKPETENQLGCGMPTLTLTLAVQCWPVLLDHLLHPQNLQRCPLGHALVIGVPHVIMDRVSPRRIGASVATFLTALVTAGAGSAGQMVVG